MNTRPLIEKDIEDFKEHLISEEKSVVTVEKYIHDVSCFYDFLNGQTISKDIVLQYKQYLLSKYSARSVNSMLASVNSMLGFLNCEDCKVKSLKIQRKVYSSENEELTKQEYFRLISAAKNNARLCMILKTICATGIRVSELSYFTVESVRRATVTVSCKNKTRNILVPEKLRKQLLNYAKCNGITSGIIFRTRSGKPINRSNIWAEMKKLCSIACVDPKKVFPHNLRKLFARTFYTIEKDIAKLADILGHSSVDTTRIYIITTMSEHQKKIDRLGLVI